MQDWLAHCFVRLADVTITTFDDPNAGASASFEGTYVHAMNSAGVITGDYDHIFIDCPPSLGLLTLNAMSAADALIVPIQAEYFALEGLGQLTHVIELVRSHLNAHVRILGVLITMFDGRTNLATQGVSEVEKFFPGLVFATRIPRSIRLSEAPSHGAPITVFDPKGKGAAAYAALAMEVLSRE